MTYLDKVSSPLDKEIARQSIYACLGSDLKLSICLCQKGTIDHANDRDKILMDQERDQQVVSVKSRVHLADVSVSVCEPPQS